MTDELAADTARATFRKQLYALSAAFSLLGFSFSTWASRVPDIRDAAALTAATLGYALLMRGGSTVIMMPVVAVLVNRFGAKKIALISGSILSMSLVPLIFAGNWIVVGVILFVLGMGASGYNISINALGSQMEAESGRSYMSRIHSWFGVGNLTGALIGTLATTMGVPVSVHFTGITILMVGILMAVYRFLPDDNTDASAVKQKFSMPHRGLLALGVICFLAATIESSVTNWVGIFFTDHVEGGDKFAPVGYTAYAGAMLATRLIGDDLKQRFGARILLMAGPVIAAAGIVLAIVSASLVSAAIGFLLAGAGVAFTFPMLFSAAGKEGAVALTTVATFGYIGGMVSQPLVGLIVEQFQIQGGFYFIALACVLVAVLASVAAMLKRS